MEEPATEEELQRFAELQTIAFDCARSGGAESLGKMIDSGFSVDLQDEQGNSFLMLASYHGELATVEMLLAKGGEVDLRNGKNQTPLGGVAFKGYPEVAKCLLAHGADTEAEQGRGMTPLMVARMFGRTDVEEILLEFGSEVKSISLASRIVGKLLRIFHPAVR